MSFPEYLKERISEDYKNLIIQKLEEIKGQTEGLKNIEPSVAEIHQSLRDSLQSEIDRIVGMLQAELDAAGSRMTEQLNAAQTSIAEQLESTQNNVSTHLNDSLEQFVSSWYYGDISAFDQQLEILLSDILSNIPVPPKKENAALKSLTDFMQELDGANTQSEILNIVLRHISGWVDRAILFVVKGEQASGWAALGLDGDWDAARVRQIRVDLQKDTLLREVLQRGTGVSAVADQFADNDQIFSTIGDPSPTSVLGYPILVRGKIAGVLYADLMQPLSEEPDVPNLLAVATRAAGLAIDLLPGKPKQPAAVAAQVVSQHITAPPRPEPPPPPPPPAPVSVEVTAPVEKVEVVQEEAEEEKPAAEPVEEEQEAAQAVEEDAAAEPQYESDLEAEVEQEATVMMRVPVITEEDQRLHDDAKRFARLLVSEIKLYNEAQVSAGREHKDLYDRLKDDIERSRRMYMERVPTHIHSSTNYFYEELVRTLANGDPSILGM